MESPSAVCLAAVSQRAVGGAVSQDRAWLLFHFWKEECCHPRALGHSTKKMTDTLNTGNVIPQGKKYLTVES